MTYYNTIENRPYYHLFSQKNICIFKIKSIFLNNKTTNKSIPKNTDSPNNGGLPPHIDPSILEAEDYTTDLDKIEVKGSIVMSAVKAFPNNSNLLVLMLKERGIEFLFPDNWYPWKDWLSCLHEIQTRFSKTILYEMGKKISETAEFPPQINTIYDILVSSNIAYHMNYRNGRIGYYKLIEYDEDSRLAILKCHTATPTELLRGTICGVINKLKPADSSMVNVFLMKTDEPSKPEGGLSDYFKIRW